jgi:hypothetical protein
LVKLDTSGGNDAIGLPICVTVSLDPSSLHRLSIGIQRPRYGALGLLSMGRSNHEATGKCRCQERCAEIAEERD